MWLRSVVMIAATVFTATVQPQPAGIWVLSDHKEHIRGPSDRAAPSCNWRGDSGDRGAKFYMSCTSTAVNVTTVTAGAVSWELPIGFERLRQGDEVPLAGVVDNASSPKIGTSVTCSLRRTRRSSRKVASPSRAREPAAPVR